MFPFRAFSTIFQWDWFFNFQFLRIGIRFSNFGVLGRKREGWSQDWMSVIIIGGNSHYAEIFGVYMHREVWFKFVLGLHILVNVKMPSNRLIIVGQTSKKTLVYLVQRGSRCFLVRSAPYNYPYTFLGVFRCLLYFYVKLSVKVNRRRLPLPPPHPCLQHQRCFSKRLSE